MKVKLKITIAASIFPPDIGGPATYSRVITDRLLATGYGVTVVAFSNPGIRRAAEVFPPDQHFKIVRVSRRWPRGLRHILYFFRLYRLARYSHAIFAQNATSVGVPALLVTRLLDKPLAVKIVIDSTIEVARGPSRWRGRLQRFVARRADQVIVPCAYLKQVVVDWGVPAEKIRVIYNGVTMPVLLPWADARAKLNLPSGGLILTVARLVPGKGLRMLIKLMPKLTELISPHLKLVIVGDGPDAANLQRMVENLRLKNKVWLVGKKTPTELTQYYAAADAFVLNSYSEGFSHVLLEALAAGLPVVTTAVGGTPEIIRNGENGLLLPYNDETGLLETLKIIFQNNELTARLKAAGLQTAQAFGVERMVAATVTALTELQNV